MIWSGVLGFVVFKISILVNRPLFMLCSFFTFVQKYRFELFSENLSTESSSLVLIHNR